jgi:hypothetical protein
MAAAVQDVFWFEPEHLTQEQQTKLVLLRQELQHKLLAEETLSDDLTLLRFLKARSWCVHKAAKLYEVGVSVCVVCRRNTAMETRAAVKPA